MAFQGVGLFGRGFALVAEAPGVAGAVGIGVILRRGWGRGLVFERHSGAPLVKGKTECIYIVLR